MVVLISGGLDSPVAAWLMMKRGVMIYSGSISNDTPDEQDEVNRTCF
jgi:thiamine biosynthesis protein ThiI